MSTAVEFKITKDDLKNLEVMQLQIENGYHISRTDYDHFLDTVITVQNLFLKAKQRYNNESEQ